MGAVLLLSLALPVSSEELKPWPGKAKESPAPAQPPAPPAEEEKPKPEPQPQPPVKPAPAQPAPHHNDPVDDCLQGCDNFLAEGLRSCRAPGNLPPDPDCRGKVINAANECRQKCRDEE